jgi:hypothetical protein
MSHPLCYTRHTIMEQAKLLYQNCGTNWAVGISCSDETLLEQTFNSFWNHGATSSEPHKLAGDLWYFWTTPKKLLKAMTNAALFKLLNDAGGVAWKHTKGGAMPQARIMAKQRMDEMESDNFFSPRSKSVRAAGAEDCYSLGTIRAENLSDTDA